MFLGRPALPHRPPAYSSDLDKLTDQLQERYVALRDVLFADPNDWDTIVDYSDPDTDPRFATPDWNLIKEEAKKITMELFEKRFPGLHQYAAMDAKTYLELLTALELYVQRHPDRFAGTIHPESNLKG